MSAELFEGSATDPRVAIFIHDPPVSGRATGLFPLLRHLDAHMILYDATWARLQERSWTAGRLLRLAGMRYYGSAWNSLLPVVDDIRLSRAFRATGADVAHFLWGEFASPVSRRRYRTARAIVGTFHASARKLPQVLSRKYRWGVYDFVTLMSASQVAFFVDAGVPEERLRVILHGVDTQLFTPAAARAERHDEPLRGLICGSTERDHDFVAAVMKKVDPSWLRMTVVAPPEQQRAYRGAPNVDVRSHVAFDELLRLYQEADVLLMPVHDATANNAILESMACGTPVVVNRVGGIPEYVDPACNYILDGKNVDEWIDLVRALAGRRNLLVERRPAVRAWVERFDWRLKAVEYRKVYAEAMNR